MYITNRTARKTISHRVNEFDLTMLVDLIEVMNSHDSLTRAKSRLSKQTDHTKESTIFQRENERIVQIL